MNTGSIRRGQLVAPFGVGSMSVLVDGTSVITGGLDHWFQNGDDSSLVLEEFVEHDWRLELRLSVREFRLPPSYRRPQGGDQRNAGLTVPVLRFPRWCFCMFCKRLKLSTFSMQQRVECPDAVHFAKNTKSFMAQVPFVAICAAGHIDDFPFYEWVHRSRDSICVGALRLRSRGGGSLDGQVVECDGCGMEKSLNRITESRTAVGGGETTFLSDQLIGKNDPFLCKGARPWLGEMNGICDLPMRGAIRGAGNVYFPKVESSIYLPRRVGAVSLELHDLMKRPDVGPVVSVLRSALGDAVTVQDLRNHLPDELFAPVSDDELFAAYLDRVGDVNVPTESDDNNDDEMLTGNAEWRFPEYSLLRETPNDAYLAVTDPGIPMSLSTFLDRVRSVGVLRETRALRGFTRVRDDVLKLSEGKALLRRSPLSPERDWLPAYVVKGEGIYFELEETRLSAWENRRDVIERSEKILYFLRRAGSRHATREEISSPRFVLLHTLGHLLINELIFSCGYSSASLRERLYSSASRNRRMAGLLIYTAAGDSEGTMGGLVRMARPERFQSTFERALAHARWCSTDPVCMDAGDRGQGPDSCNLAACHGCAFLPETSCEEFNRFLDRGLVIGTFDNPLLGYFSESR
jgi:hypothetical protein